LDIGRAFASDLKGKQGIIKEDTSLPYAMDEGPDSDT
jgi:hypothetical protein